MISLKHELDYVTLLFKVSNGCSFRVKPKLLSTTPFDLIPYPSPIGLLYSRITGLYLLLFLDYAKLI